MGLNTGLVSAHLRKCDKLMIRDLIISAGGKAGVTLLNPVIKMQLLAEERGWVEGNNESLLNNVHC